MVYAMAWRLRTASQGRSARRRAERRHHQNGMETTMSFSVNTNTGALIALQYLNATQAQLTQTQNEINSGLKVATAKDDGATYAIAQNQRGAVAGYAAVTDSLSRGSSAIDVALS